MKGDPVLDSDLVIIIGRGHSGTRVIGRLLYENGYVTGQINSCYDMIPPEEMYCAAKFFGEKVRLADRYEWDFNVGETTLVFKELIMMYLSCLDGTSGPRYFKLPETTLCYPWIVQMLPRAQFIHWVRDPRDAGAHLTDDFRRWKIPVPPDLIQPWLDMGVEPAAVRTAISCKYQWDLVESTPRPENFLRIRYEDFCADQPAELRRLEAYLGRQLQPVGVHTASIGRWRKVASHFEFPFLSGMLERGGYR
jgi:hypothetical protein